VRGGSVRSRLRSSERTAARGSRTIHTSLTRSCSKYSRYRSRRYVVWKQWRPRSGSEEPFARSSAPSSSSSCLHDVAAKLGSRRRRPVAAGDQPSVGIVVEPREVGAVAHQRIEIVPRCDARIAAPQNQSREMRTAFVPSQPERRVGSDGHHLYGVPGCSLNPQASMQFPCRSTAKTLPESCVAQLGTASDSCSACSSSAAARANCDRFPKIARRCAQRTRSRNRPTRRCFLAALVACKQRGTWLALLDCPAVGWVAGHCGPAPGRVVCCTRGSTYR
jgi:hypothetical protein